MMSNNEIINRNKRMTSTGHSSKIIPNVEKIKADKSSSGMKIPIQIGSSVVLGIVFGILMNKANVYLAPIIRDQMLFKRLTMIKMFLAAVGMSMLSVCAILLINEAIYRKVLNGFIQRNNRINALQLLVGGSLIGVGMVLAGSCPGTVFVQIGSGLRNSIATGLGGCCGVIFYYLFLHSFINQCELSQSSIVLEQLPNLTGIKRLYLNLMMGLIMISMAFTLEYVVPYETDFIRSKESILNGWSPTWCGLGIGLLQLFFMIIFEKSLGISSGFTVIVAQLCRIKIFKELIPSLESFTYGIQNSLTLLFSIGAIVGSFLASYLSNQFPLNENYGANIWNSFFGGFLLLLGARCAGGCTSGQGISGVTHLLLGSFLATAAIFGGGIFFAISYGLITKDWQFNAL